MKKIIIATALAVIAASPALAAKQGQPYRNTAAAGSYASAPAAGAGVFDGKVVGTDPDAFIRGSLIRQNNPADLAGN